MMFGNPCIGTGCRSCRGEFRLRWGWGFRAKAVGAHQHARGAKAALQTVLFVKAFLHRMQHTFVGQAFDGQDFGAVALNGQMCAGFNRLAIDVYRTNTAVAGFTTNVRASKVEFFAQKWISSVRGSTAFSSFLPLTETVMSFWSWCIP